MPRTASDSTCVKHWFQRVFQTMEDRRKVPNWLSGKEHITIFWWCLPAMSLLVCKHQQTTLRSKTMEWNLKIFWKPFRGHFKSIQKPIFQSEIWWMHHGKGRFSPTVTSSSQPARFLKMLVLSDCDAKQLLWITDGAQIVRGVSKNSKPEANLANTTWGVVVLCLGF